MRPPSRRRATALVALLCLSVFAAEGTGAGATGSAPSPSTTSNGQGTLLVVGDSLMEGTTVIGMLRDKLVSLRTWPSVVVDYKRGRTTVQGTRVLASRLAGIDNPTAIVVALGTNDMLHNSRFDYATGIIDRLMQESLGIPVLWVNISFSRNHPDWRLRASRFNRALLAARSDWPNLSVADWSGSFVPAGRSNYIVDGIHLSNSGYRTRAAWLALQTGRFGSALVNATTTTTTLPSTTTTSPPTTVPSPTTVAAPPTT